MDASAELTAVTLQAISNATAEARLHIVIKWCYARHVTVEFRNLPSKYLPSSKKIVINKRSSRKHQLMILLHECGHHLIDSSPVATKRYKNGWDAEDPKILKTFTHRIDVLAEEIEAWDRGWNLALRLGVLTESNRQAFDKVRTSMLKSYIKWAANVK